jgi:hypothetical protein
VRQRDGHSHNRVHLSSEVLITTISQVSPGNIPRWATALQSTQFPSTPANRRDGTDISGQSPIIQPPTLQTLPILLLSLSPPQISLSTYHFSLIVLRHLSLIRAFEIQILMPTSFSLGSSSLGWNPHAASQKRHSTTGFLSVAMLRSSVTCAFYRSLQAKYAGRARMHAHQPSFQARDGASLRWQLKLRAGSAGAPISRQV